MSGLHRARILKHSLLLAESRHRLSELENSCGHLQFKKDEYEKKSSALLQSAVSVIPEHNSEYPAFSLLQRSAWIDKACQLRKCTISGMESASSALRQLVPQLAVHTMNTEVLENRKSEAEMELRLSGARKSLIAEMAEVEDINEVSVAEKYRREGSQ
jgi:hypothetical protein